MTWGLPDQASFLFLGRRRSRRRVHGSAFKTKGVANRFPELAFANYDVVLGLRWKGFFSVPLYFRLKVSLLVRAF